MPRRHDTAERFGFDKSEPLYEPDPAGKGIGTYRMWIENPDEIVLLKRTWALHQVGEGPTRIAEALNAAELPAKRGSPWSPETVRGQIMPLTNPELQELYRTVLTSDEGD